MRVLGSVIEPESVYVSLIDWVSENVSVADFVKSRDEDWVSEWDRVYSGDGENVREKDTDGERDSVGVEDADFGSDGEKDPLSLSDAVSVCVWLLSDDIDLVNDSSYVGLRVIVFVSESVTVSDIDSVNVSDWLCDSDLEVSDDTESEILP